MYIGRPLLWAVWIAIEQSQIYLWYLCRVTFYELFIAIMMQQNCSERHFSTADITPKSLICCIQSPLKFVFGQRVSTAMSSGWRKRDRKKIKVHNASSWKQHLELVYEPKHLTESWPLSYDSQCQTKHNTNAALTSSGRRYLIFSHCYQDSRWCHVYNLSTNCNYHRSFLNDTKEHVS